MDGGTLAGYHYTRPATAHTASLYGDLIVPSSRAPAYAIWLSLARTAFGVVVSLHYVARHSGRPSLARFWPDV